MNSWALYFWQSLAVALPLFVFLGATWWWLAGSGNEDVPDPSWTDYLGDLAGLLMVFPVGVVFWSGLDHPLVAIFCLSVDCLFWGGAIVLSYRMVKWYFSRAKLD